jgi:hypothetical protein
MDDPRMTPVARDLAMKEITNISLRLGMRVVVEAPLPLSPEGLQTRASVVAQIKNALRHYKEKEPA